ncbi:hypothetical protein JZ751_027255 [Albula glossodonta]|uniref:LRRCT domain-containing protein n=1 Tax=Albula glossodonta TaxID=121402 RepID=A0A8T2NNP3_9TELE|nr:hypothetical protein JZ751_027255 [Albula glossodonta]
MPVPHRQHTRGERTAPTENIATAKNIADLIKTLPYEGILEQIPGIVEVLLDDNPWDCNCDLVSLKEWLENIPHNSLIGRVICEAPTRLQGNDLNETSEMDLCPSKNGVDSSLVAPPTQDQTSDSGPVPTTHKVNRVLESPTPESGHKGRSKSRENWQLKTKPTVMATVNGKSEQAYNVSCPLSCSCELLETRQGLRVNCEGKKIDNLFSLKPKPLNAHELNLRDNNIHTVKKNHFAGHQSLNLLDLGGNNIKWTEKLGSDVIVSDLKCESPEEFWKKDFRYLANDVLCPQLYDKISPTSASKNSTFAADAGSRGNSYLEQSKVSISVLVPGLLLVFVTSAFTVVGMLVFILRNRKRSKRRDGNSSASEINSLQTVCDSSYWHSGTYHTDGSHRVYECGTHALSDQ